ncbi:hypothetical protein PR001_g23421 [Phytophthora rubi]|uniref:Uncharacterized protein n=1 Tax=Phytophthora rubi TaxID=129364 RepID=A0A6A3IN97_9STRA|nr:hypothetical protein PR002_g23853 [Phytophthora rubi]KAE8983527.1 hypothetical protein PR001_g23421 [Phytophthora rubi]
MVTSVTSSGLGTVTLGKEVSRSSAGRGNNMGYSSIFGNGSILVGGSLLTGAGRLARPVGVDHVHGGHGECGADIASVSSRLLMGSSVAVSGAVIVSSLGPSHSLVVGGLSGGMSGSSWWWRAGRNGRSVHVGSFAGVSFVCALDANSVILIARRYRARRRAAHRRRRRLRTTV